MTEDDFPVGAVFRMRITPESYVLGSGGYGFEWEQVEEPQEQVSP